MRLDRAIVARGLARSRAEAQGLIAAGQVRVAGMPAARASQPISDEAAIDICGELSRFVSRGGLNVQDRRALDVGASTGGFTDCLLQRGARQVVSVDVGHGQMVPALAADPRVKLREGVNARNLSSLDFPHPFDLIVADISFISLTLALPALAPLLHPEGDLVCLVKPQFEVGVERLGKGGIVRDAQARKDALDRVAAAAKAQGLAERGRMDSPILGAHGNREFLLWLARAGTKAAGSE